MGTPSLGECPGGQEDQPSCAADMKGTTDETGKLGKSFRDRLNVSGNPTSAETKVPMLSTLRWARESI